MPWPIGNVCQWLTIAHKDASTLCCRKTLRDLFLRNHQTTYVFYAPPVSVVKGLCSYTCLAVTFLPSTCFCTISFLKFWYTFTQCGLFLGAYTEGLYGITKLEQQCLSIITHRILTLILWVLSLMEIKCFDDKCSLYFVYVRNIILTY